jgi:ABC-type dipeptide/oligopeptide/nickel transport system permease component
LKMRYYVTRRLLLLIPVLFGVTLVTFSLSHVIGDPVAAYVTSEQIPEQRIRQLIVAHGLDKPIYVQYLYYLRDLLDGDWGISRSDSDRPVLVSIANYFPATFELTLVAMTISLVLGIPLGIVSATRKDKPVDHATRIFALSGVSMPIFWLALMMQYVFFYQLKLLSLPNLPLNQRVDQFVVLDHPLRQITGLFLIDSLATGNFPVFFSALAHIIMPAFALSYITLALITRMMRSSMLEVLRQDYITLARSKGLTERVVIYRHALRNAMVPTVTVSGLAFGGLLAGAVLTETVFSWPGVGRWSTGAILRDDIASIMGFMILVSVIYVLANLLVDLLYAALDPRIRLG